MIRNLAICLLIFLLSACAPTAAPGSTPTSMPAGSGIEGHITIGPMCPVVQINNPCPDKPYQATLTVLTTDKRKIMQFQTDASGYFYVALAPGEYILHPESPNGMPHANDIAFSVVRGQYTRVDVVYDSGIR